MDFKKAMDKAIKMCDEEKYYLFILKDGSEYYGSESDYREFTSHLNKEEKKQYMPAKSKKEITKKQVETFRTRAMRELGL